MKRRSYKILTDQMANPKTAKAAKGDDYLTAILHLAPYDLSGRQVCPFASKGCAAACLNTAGRGGIGGPDNAIQRRRIKQTLMFREDRERFWDLLISDLIKLSVEAAKEGMRPAVRLNGTSDIPWERIKVRGFDNIMSMFPGMVFYDYTKYPFTRREGLPSNYSLTFSRSEANEHEALVNLAKGRNVAVVFGTKKGEPLPATYKGHRVIDGDLDDLRFRDGRGVVVGVRAKGDGKKDTSGFVVRTEEGVPGEARAMAA